MREGPACARAQGARGLSMWEGSVCARAQRAPGLSVREGSACFSCNRRSRGRLPREHFVSLPDARSGPLAAPFQTRGCVFCPPGHRLLLYLSQPVPALAVRSVRGCARAPGTRTSSPRGVCEVSPRLRRVPCPAQARRGATRCLRPSEADARARAASPPRSPVSSRSRCEKTARFPSSV